MTPASGTAPATLSVTPSITGLAAGTYTATVTVTATTAGATGSPKTVAVTLTVSPAAVANLVGAWGFDETSGTTAADASGRGNTGTLNGATRSTGGKFGGALSFDGINDWVTVPDADVLDLTTGMTHGGLGPPDRHRRAVAHGHAQGAARQPDLRALRRRRQRAAPRATSSPPPTAASAAPRPRRSTPGPTSPRPTTEPPSACTSTACRSPRARSPASIRASTGALRIGGNNIWSDEWFAGLIDEVRVYNRALTATEIQADMAKPVSG